MFGDRSGWHIAAVILLFSGLILALSPPARAIEFPDKLQLIEMLRDGSLVRLERRLEAYQGAFENGRASDELVEAAYFAFANSDHTLVEELDRWVETSPESYVARGARGVYFWHLGWIARGVDVLQEPSRQQARVMRRFFALAESDLEAAIDMNPHFSLGYAVLISVGMASKQRDDHTFMMRRGLMTVPQSFAIREWYLASLEPWWRSGFPDKLALAVISEVVENTEKAAKRYAYLKPLTGYADYVQAQMHLQAERYPEALGSINRALAAGDHWRYHDLRGRIQFREHRCISALQSYDRALAQRPQVAAVYNMRGQVRRCVDNYEGALEDWDRALALDAMEPNYLLAKGETLQKLGEYDAARELLDKAVFYGAYDPSIRAARGALLVDHFGQADAALADLEYATETQPGRADYWRIYGDALLRLNRCDAAAALATYARLCETGSACLSDDLDWAADAIEEISYADCQG